VHGVTAARLRLIVMGTGPFAVPMFDAIRRASHDVVALVTRPDRGPPGRRPPPNPMRAAAAAAGLPILEPDRVNEPAAIAAVGGLSPDLLVVCDYGQILSAELLAVPPLGAINLHGSLLPRHRGAAPVQWAIREGDPLTGVSVIRMTPALDAGNVIVQRATAISPRETAGELEPRLAQLGAGAVVEAIERLQAAVAATGSVAGVGVPQDPARATRAPRLTTADGIVDWTLPAERLERLRRALDPWPRLTTFLTRGDGRRVRLVLDDVDVVRTGAAGDAGSPGTVLVADGDRLEVACGGGSVLAIRRLVPEGRRGMSSSEFLRGTTVVPGCRLG